MGAAAPYFPDDMTSVAGQQPKERAGPRDRRAAAIGASVLAHAAIFALIGMATAKLAAHPPRQSAVDVWLMPRLTLQPPRTKVRPAQAAPLDHAIAPKAGQTEKQRQPSPVVPAAAPSPPAGRTGGDPAPALNGPSVAAADAGGSVREALRTSVGCDFDKTMRLTPAERDRCNQRYGEAARAAPGFSGIEPGKRSRFDAQAEADERRRAGRTGPVQQLTVPCDSPDAVAVEGGGLASGCLPKSSILHIPF